MSTGTRHGFTLTELLVATILGALLVTALAMTAGVISTTVQDLRQTGDRAIEETVASVSNDIRRAWWVERPSATRIELFDPYGNRTAYELQGTDLVIERPNGHSGVVISDIASLNFSTTTKTRLRDTTPLDQHGTWWHAPEPAGTAEVLRLRDGQSVSLGFAVSSDAPDALDVVAGVEEELLQATLDRVMIAAVHVPPEIPGPGTDFLLLQLFQARNFGDASPHGLPLATAMLPATILPEATMVLTPNPPEGHTLEPASCHPGGHKGWLCHPLPTGTFEDTCVGNPSLQSHLDHGDCPDQCGSELCLNWWTWEPAVPTSLAPVDLTGLAGVVEPGHPYALVVGVYGATDMAIRNVPIGSSNPTVAVETTTGSGFSYQPLAVLHSFDGMQTFTQTVAHDIIERVQLTIERQNGSRLESSALVSGQTSVEDPWLGVVPNELPSLEQDGN